MRTLRSIRLFLLVLAILAIPATSFAQFGLSITVAPPELAVYAQPICPQAGYIWTPGYWAYGGDGYYWVPGTWVEPPAVGLLWTPGYWGWGDGRYAWNDGYWGPEVGFYGGVNYGFGYGGVGYQGGYWRNNQFSYNTYVNNIGGGHFRNTYRKTVNVNTRNYVSYNGGSGGLTARPSAGDESAAHARHDGPTAAQSGHQRAASQNYDLLASVNHGHPAIAATSKPGQFTGKGVMAARGSDENRSAENKAAATRTSENKAAENRPVENKAAATRSNENKADENRSAENKAAATRTSENKATENRLVENKAAENRSAENKAAENRVENKAAATRSNENKAADNRSAENKAAATRPSENRAAPQRAEQPAPLHVKTVAARPEAPSARTTSSQQSHQAAPRTESAPRAPAVQHQATPKQAAAPKSEPSHQSAPKQEPTKSEPR